MGGLMIKLTPELRAALEKWRRTPGAIIPLPPSVDVQTMLWVDWQDIWPERKRP